MKKNGYQQNGLITVQTVDKIYFEVKHKKNSNPWDTVKFMGNIKRRIKIQFADSYFIYLIVPTINNCQQNKGWFTV